MGTWLKELSDVLPEEWALAKAWHEAWRERKKEEGDTTNPALVDFEELTLEATKKRVWLASNTLQVLAKAETHLPWAHKRAGRKGEWKKSGKAFKVPEVLG